MFVSVHYPLWIRAVWEVLSYSNDIHEFHLHITQRQSFFLIPAALTGSCLVQLQPSGRSCCIVCVIVHMSWPDSHHRTLMGCTGHLPSEERLDQIHSRAALREACLEEGAHGILVLRADNRDNWWNSLAFRWRCHDGQLWAQSRLCVCVCGWHGTGNCG